MLSEIQTIEWLLTEWGLWAHESRGLALYFPGINNIEKLHRHQPRGSRICDADAEDIDRIVSELRLVYPKEHEAIALSYVVGLSLRKVAQRMNLSNHRVASELKTGGSRWVEGKLTERHRAPLASGGLLLVQQ